MPNEKALVTVSEDWLTLGYSAVLGKITTMPPFVTLEVWVADIHNPHGILVQSTSADEDAKKSRAFIPWKYIEGIIWNDDFEKLKSQVGFGRFVDKDKT